MSAFRRSKPVPSSAWRPSGASHPSVRLQVIRCLLVSAAVTGALFALVWIVGPDAATQVELFGP